MLDVAEESTINNFCKNDDRNRPQYSHINRSWLSYDLATCVLGVHQQRHRVNSLGRDFQINKHHL